MSIQKLNESPADQGLLIGWTTVADRETALRLAREAVGEVGVACAQIDGPLISVFSWEGAVCEEEEWRLWLKFAACVESRVTDWLSKAHPYETPQWIIVEASQVSSTYLDWVQAHAKK